MLEQQKKSLGSILVLGQTQFPGSKFKIFGGFGWVFSSILLDKPEFGRVRISVFPDLGLGSARFWPNKFEGQAFCRGLKWFEIQFGGRTWVRVSSKFDLSSLKQFEVCYIWILCRLHYLLHGWSVYFDLFKES